MSEEKDKKEEVKETSPEAEVSVPKKFQSLVNEIEKMSVIDLAELVKILEKKFGVSAAAPMAAAAPVAPEADEAAPEKSAFDVVLAGIGEQKIEVIKVVRDITGLGLKEAKDLVDQAEKEPQKVKEGVKKEEAEEMVKKMEGAGAKVELK
ncbi:MAG TPA: 50S ribosomal protein L7/L12 [Candidatus Pacearchaeota archaeon]|nr:50S ribosomal protein L7/L12 [Candidatus Pacearchaeota archaeon]